MCEFTCEVCTGWLDLDEIFLEGIEADLCYDHREMLKDIEFQEDMLQGLYDLAISQRP